MAGETVATVNQKIEDHLLECVTTRVQIYNRLSRIENGLIAIGVAIIMSLSAAVVSLVVEIYHLQTPRPQTAMTMTVAIMHLPYQGRKSYERI